MIDKQGSESSQQRAYARFKSSRKYRKSDDYSWQNSADYLWQESDKDKDKDDDDGSGHEANSSSNFGKSWAPSTEYARSEKALWDTSTVGQQGSPPPDYSPLPDSDAERENESKWKNLAAENKEAIDKKTTELAARQKAEDEEKMLQREGQQRYNFPEHVSLT